MYALIKMLFPVMLMLGGHATWATPQADARLIAQRELDVAWKGHFEKSIRSYFVAVYFEPISGLGITIADEEAFRGLIPDEEVAPYLEKMVSITAEKYFSILSSERLAQIAAILRADEEATMAEILSEEYERKFALALEQARAKAKPSGSDDPTTVQLEELTIQLEALSASFEDGGAEALARSIGFGIGPLIILERYYRAIKKIEVRPDNPVTLSAIKAKGVLRFANPVQRQSLIRRLSRSKAKNGIQFIKPPVSRTHSN